MKHQFGSMATGEPATVNHIILGGCVVVLTDGRAVIVPAKEALVTNVWAPSTPLEIFKNDQASLYPLCVRNIVEDEEVHGRWAPGITYQGANECHGRSV